MVVDGMYGQWIVIYCPITDAKCSQDVSPSSMYLDFHCVRTNGISFHFRHLYFSQDVWSGNLMVAESCPLRPPETGANFLCLGGQLGIVLQYFGWCQCGRSQIRGSKRVHSCQKRPFWAFLAQFCP